MFFVSVGLAGRLVLVDFSIPNYPESSFCVVALSLKKKTHVRTNFLMDGWRKVDDTASGGREPLVAFQPCGCSRTKHG